MLEIMKQKGKKATMLAAALLLITGVVHGQIQTCPGAEKNEFVDAIPVDSTADFMTANKTEVRKVGGNAAALAALKPLQYNAGQTTQIMAGVGTYRGQTAGALGVAHYTSQNLMYHAGVSLGGAHSFMGNAGVTLGFGPGATAQTESSKVDMLQKAVDRLIAENAEIKAENAQIKVALHDMYAKLNNK